MRRFGPRSPGRTVAIPGVAVVSVPDLRQKSLPVRCERGYGRAYRPAASDEIGEASVLTGWPPTRTLGTIVAGVACPPWGQVTVALRWRIGPGMTQVTVRAPRLMSTVGPYRDLERRPEIRGRRLMELFGLTSAEARLAVALVQDHRLEDIAAGSSVRMPTIRTQLRATLAKTGTHRQAELVRLLLTLPTVSPPR